MIGGAFILNWGSQDLLVGPFLGLDAKTVMSSLTIDRTNVYWHVAQPAPVVMTSTIPATNLGGGYYKIHFDGELPYGTMTRACVIINMPNCLPYAKHFICDFQA